MAKPHIVNLTKAAEIFGYSHTTIQNYIKKEGAPVVAKPGRKGAQVQIDTVAFLQFLINRRLDAAEDDQPSDYKRASLGKLVEEERRLAIGNAKELAQLVAVDDVDAVFSETLVIIRAQLEGAAGRIGGGNKVLRSRLLNEFRRILEVAEERLGEYLEGTAAEVEATKAAA